MSNNNDLDALIEALTILRKYGNPEYPTHCEHDVLYVGIHPKPVSEQDMRRLKELSFNPGKSNDDDPEDPDGFISFRFGAW